MSVLIILIGASLIVAFGFLIAFLWAVKNGQFSDTYTPSVRMLFDDNDPGNKNSDEKSKNKDEKDDNINSVNKRIK